ncbi:MAG: mobilization protein [Alphaproteobacteria bacterium]|nr:mobilization protein [Alphaproteobacteria bacterium]
MKKPIDERKAALERKLEALKGQLKALSAAEVRQRRREDTRRKIIVGALVLGAAEGSRHHKEWLMSVLEGAPQRPQDVAIIADLLAELRRTVTAEPAAESAPEPAAVSE